MSSSPPLPAREHHRRAETAAPSTSVARNATSSPRPSSTIRWLSASRAAVPGCVASHSRSLTGACSTTPSSRAPLGSRAQRAA